jgi:hypothetical protein
MEALDPRTARLVAIAMALYVIGTLVAILVHRHLFGDAAWYVVKALSDGHPVILEPDLPVLYRSRWFAMELTQGPMVWASQLGVTSLTALSWIYGLTMYAHRAVSLLLCWIWLRDKRLFLFPLASLFAGSINADLYIVSETHFLLSLVWPLFVLLLAADLTPGRRVWLVLIAIPTLLAYESMMFFGPLLIFASGFRARERWADIRDRVLLLAVAAWFTLGTIFALAASIWPRDPSNRGSFLSGIPEALARGHLGVAASIAFIAIVPIVTYLWPRQRKVSIGLLAVPVAIGAVYAGRMFVDPGVIDFETHAYARGISALTPLPLCMIFVALSIIGAAHRSGWMPGLMPCLRAVAVLGVCQCVWAMGATVVWANMVTALRLELARTPGVVPYESSVLAQRTFRGMPMEQLHMVWPLLPMSIVLGGSRDVSSVVFDEHYPFMPFDPRHAEQLPDLSRFGITYEGLKAALDRHARVDFRPGGNSQAFLGEGWSEKVDEWAHWTDGPRATIRLGKPHRSERGERGGELEMTLSAFVSPRHPRQRVTVSLNGRQLGIIELTEAQVGSGPAKIHLPVPSGVDACGDEMLLTLDLPDAQSPKNLGLSDDFRRLGIAMIELRMGPRS